MAANTAPIFTLTGVLSNSRWTSSLSANAKNDGSGTIGTDLVVAATGGTDGTYIKKVRLVPSASAAATSTTATVARLYKSTQTSGATTASNTWLLDERPCPSVSAAQATVAVPFIEIPCDFVLPSGVTLLFSMHHAAAANTSWAVTVFGGDY